MNWHIESACPGDFAQVAALDRLAWLHTQEPFIADGEHVWRVWCEYATVLVARLNRSAEGGNGAAGGSGGAGGIPGVPGVPGVGGALVMFPTGDNELFLHKIMVHPDHRSHGIGKGLLQAGLAKADRPVLLTVDPGNTAAVGLYRKLGFVLRQHVPGYYRAHEHRDVMVYHPPARTG